MSEYSNWWHDASGAPGSAVALDARRRSHHEHGGRVLEVLDHERFGRLVALDGALVFVEEDAAWREMLVHVVLGALPGGALRVHVHEDPALAAEALRRDEVAAVEVDARDPELFPEWARAVGLDLADRRLRVRMHASGEPVDVSFGAALGRVAVTGGAVMLERRGARWLHEQATPDGRRAVARWFAMSPLAPCGFYGYTAYAAEDLDLSTPRRPFDGRHYNPDLHRAAFALPTFLRELA